MKWVFNLEKKDGSSLLDEVGQKKGIVLFGLPGM
jgi:hypothetical protein